MAAQFLTARFDNGSLIVAIHLDTTKTKNGGPDPAYVRTYSFGVPKRNAGETQPAYRTRLRTFADAAIPEAKLLAQADAVVAVPDPAGQFSIVEEGTTFLT